MFREKDQQIPQFHVLCLSPASERINRRTGFALNNNISFIPTQSKFTFIYHLLLLCFTCLLTYQPKMASSTSTLGLRAALPFLSTPHNPNPNQNHAPAYLAFHFLFAYGVLSSRTLKQWYGLDHNASPRYDLIQYGDAAVASGQITRSQLEMLRRTESASANAVEN